MTVFPQLAPILVATDAARRPAPRPAAPSSAAGSPRPPGACVPPVPTPRPAAGRLHRRSRPRRRRSPFCPPPAEPAAALAYSRRDSGAAPAAEEGRGAEAQVRRTGSPSRRRSAFPACGPPTRSPATAASPGRGSRRARAPTSASRRPTRASTSICRTPARPTPASRGAACSARSSSTRPSKLDVDEDFVVVLSDWSVDDKRPDQGRLSPIPALARGAGRRGSVVFANAAAAPLALEARPGARVRLRLGNAATARLTNVAIDGAQDADRRRRRPAERPVRAACATSSRWVPAPGSSLCSTCRARRARRSGSCCAGRPARRTSRSSTIAADGEPVAAALRADPPAAQSGAAGRDRARGGAQLRRRRHRRRRGAVRGQRRDLRGLGAEAARAASRAARRPCSPSPTGPRSCRRCGSAATSPASCIRWTTAGSPTGATPS